MHVYIYIYIYTHISVYNIISQTASKRTTVTLKRHAACWCPAAKLLLAAELGVTRSLAKKPDLEVQGSYGQALKGTMYTEAKKILLWSMLGCNIRSFMAYLDVQGGFQGDYVGAI